MELLEKIKKDYLRNEKSLKGKYTLQEYILKILEDLIISRKKEIARLARLKKKVKMYEQKYKPIKNTEKKYERQSKR